MASLGALIAAGCHSEADEPTGQPAAGGDGAASVGGAAHAGDGSEAGAPGKPTNPGSFGLIHAAEGLESLKWTLSTPQSELESGELGYVTAARLEMLPPGDYTLELTLADESISRELRLREGAELQVVVTAAVTSDTERQVSVVDIPAAGSDSANDGAARFYLINAVPGDARTFDVGIDNLAEPDGTVEPGATSEAFSLDVTRPAVAFLKDGAVTDDFTLPVPMAGSSVISVLLGSPAAAGPAGAEVRLLVARMSTEPVVSEVQADPTIYFLHASAAHSGVDLFIGPENPRASLVVDGPQRVRTFAVSHTTNQRLIRAELVDDARFGELRTARSPAGAATLEAYLTIPGDPQLPVPLNYNLVGNLLPNQRLRNGAAIGRQGAQTVGGELKGGAEYLVILPSDGPWFDNRVKFGEDAPELPFERIERKQPSPDVASLRLAAAVTRDGVGLALPVDIALDGETVITGLRPFQLNDARSVTPGPHRLTFDIEAQVELPAPRLLELDVHAGQDLLVIATGDARPAAVTLESKPRLDDADADGTVAASVDPQTQRSVDPNYLPADGNSELIQDDCPTQPGPRSQKGCPAPGLHWLVLDLSTKPPTVRVLPMN